MRRLHAPLRRNGEPWLVQELRAGRLTPDGVVRRLEALRTELDDAVFFKKPEAEIEKILQEIASIEGSLEAGRAAFQEGIAERSRVYTTELKKTKESPRAVERTSKEQDADELDRLRALLRILQRDWDDGVRMRGQAEMDALSKRIYETRQAIREYEADLSRATTRNPRRVTSRLLKRPRYIDGVVRDLAAGKISTNDIARSLDRYKRLLGETLSQDGEAHQRVQSLQMHIADLESLLAEGN